MTARLEYYHGVLVDSENNLDNQNLHVFRDAEILQHLIKELIEANVASIRGGYKKVCALMLFLFNGITYHTKPLSCVKPIFV